MADAKRVCACFDQPDLRAVYRVCVIAPAAWKVISNARAQEHVLLEAHTARWVFEPTRPLPTYLVAVVAGPYMHWRDAYTRGRAPRYPWASTDGPRSASTWTRSIFWKNQARSGLLRKCLRHA